MNSINIPTDIKRHDTKTKSELWKLISPLDYQLTDKEVFVFLMLLDCPDRSESNRNIIAPDLDEIDLGLHSEFGSQQPEGLEIIKALATNHQLLSYVVLHLSWTDMVIIDLSQFVAKLKAKTKN